MEDPAALLGSILAFAARNEGITAVVQTGSRARGQLVDAFSDLDIELIGPGTAELVDRDEWVEQIGALLVSIHLRNDGGSGGAGEPEWPTCLAVFAGGRKVDFTLAGPERLERMLTRGLDELYQRGYLVHLDKSGITDKLAPSHPRTPKREAPAEDAFLVNQREFWFEATQVPIYAARGDLWPAMLRLAELRELLLAMLEWNAIARDPGLDHWHNGHHLGEWLAEPYRGRLAELFASYDTADVLRALWAAVELYAVVTVATGAMLELPVLGLRDRVVAHIAAVSGRF